MQRPHEELFEPPPPAPPRAASGSGCWGPVLVILALTGGAGLWFRSAVGTDGAKQQVDRLLHPPPRSEPQRDRSADPAGEVLADLDRLGAALAAFQRVGRPPLQLAPCPVADPGVGGLPWVGECTAAWEALGWSPAHAGCRYSVVAPPGTLRALAECDHDADGVWEIYTVDAGKPPERARSVLIR